MDKNAIKKYAVWARRELISRVSQKALQYGITDKSIVEATADSINGKVLSASEKRQRQALISQIRAKGYEQVMEEVAYTWFNRFSALRFMEVNGYLPSRVRVFTDENNQFEPQIIAEAIDLEIDGLDMDRVYSFKDANDDEGLFKYLLIVQCNALNKILPGMFQRIEDYTELLLPDNLLRDGSVIEQMVTIIPEEDWKDQVQIIGWLYQFYIAEPKDTLINARKQYKDKDIAFVTQLFTSDWIVRYMVENSLGRYWHEHHPDTDLIRNWPYYLLGNVTVTSPNADNNPEEIKVLDCCMGSGHILVYAFDLLIQMYESYGYTTREAVANIVQKNLWGLDIDERATQLAYFAIMMKARQYDRRFFARGIQPNVFAIRESNCIDKASIECFTENDPQIKGAIASILEDFRDAKEFGSLLNVRRVDFQRLYQRFDELRDEISIYTTYIFDELYPLVRIADVISCQYDVVVTNPPYMNSTYMPDKLKDFVLANYADFKSDMFAAFIAKVIRWTKVNGHIGMLTPYVWLFILSYEKLREFVVNNSNISSLVQLEYNAFEGACVPVCAFTLSNNAAMETGEYIRLSDFKGIENQAPRTLYAAGNPDCEYRYTTKQSNYSQIPGTPIAYWLSDDSVGLFTSGSLLSEYADLKQGLITGDNNRFLRFWHECPSDAITVDVDHPRKWFFYHKGGEYRKWYGNINLVVNWENDGDEIINFRDEKGKQKSRPQNVRFYLKEGFTWTALTIADFNVRYMPSGSIFDAKGSSGFVKNPEELFYYIGLCNSKVAMEFLSFLAPTMDYNAGAVAKLPIIKDALAIKEVSVLVRRAIEISKQDWDSYEESWDFVRHPLVGGTVLSEQYKLWEDVTVRRHAELKDIEEKINEIFISLYGFTGKMTPIVADDAVTVRCANVREDIKNLISYAVGCMFGRYSLDAPGLAYAGGEWDDSKYVTFFADRDSIIPICDDDYFSDDIVSRFVRFIEVVYGKDTLHENLRFIAEALGGSGQPKEVIRKYFMDEFYNDHLKIYQKRPIYWQFESGKKGGFKALVYMHRYQPDTIARMRTDYVHEQQARYRTAIADLETRIANAATSERVKLNKQLKTLNDQATEIHAYEEKIHHLADQMISIDLDDGVKKNYEIFKDVLAKIK